MIPVRASRPVAPPVRAVVARPAVDCPDVAALGFGADAWGLSTRLSTVGVVVLPALGAMATVTTELGADRLPAASRARTWYEYVVPGAVVVSVNVVTAPTVASVAPLRRIW